MDVVDQSEIVLRHHAERLGAFPSGPNLNRTLGVSFCQSLHGQIGSAVAEFFRPEPEKLIDDPLPGDFEPLDSLANFAQTRRGFHRESRAICMRVLLEFSSHQEAIRMPSDLAGRRIDWKPRHSK